MTKYIKLEDAIEAVTSIFRVSALFGGINDNEDMWREKAEKVFAKCEVVTGTAKQGLEHIEVSEDCISREYVFEKAQEWKNMYPDSDTAREALTMMMNEIENAPSVVPSRATGKWKDISTSYTRQAECSLCGGFVIEAEYDFCPHCGAIMMESDTE